MNKAIADKENEMKVWIDGYLKYFDLDDMIQLVTLVLVAIILYTGRDISVSTSGKVIVIGAGDPTITNSHFESVGCGPAVEIRDLEQ